MRTECSQDVVVQATVRNDDATIGRKFPAVSELQRPTVNVGDSAAGFFDNKHSACVIPNFFAIVFLRRQAEIDIPFTASDDRILRLTVEPDR